MFKIFVSFILVLQGYSALSAYINIQKDDAYDVFQVEIENPITPGSNVSLDVKNSTHPGYWTYPGGNVPQWMEYHIDTSTFLNEADNSRMCASVMSDSDMNKLSNVPGLWVACQDKYLPGGCESVGNSPCHPFIEFERRYLNLRTIKVSFAIYELALLRITTDGLSSGDCFEYGLRKDPFSSCTFTQLGKNADDEDGWRQLVFTLADENKMFSKFRIQLIARFGRDVVIIDKIEASSHYLCDDGVSPCPTTTINPSSDYTDTDSTDTDSSNPTTVKTTTETITESTISYSNTETTTRLTFVTTEVDKTSTFQSTIEDISSSTEQITFSTPPTSSTDEPNIASKNGQNSFLFIVGIVLYKILF